ncbi:MAG: glycosyltransferase [Phocaeicola sp.]|nr:glycosyltransferase [Phocaeicola sp.]
MIQNLTIPAPLVSFVMPAYKGLWIRKAIDSILAQTYQNIELIIVDDVSPEDLYSIVSSIVVGFILGNTCYNS